MRHGEAEEHSPDGDSGRRLTREGADAVSRSSAALARLAWIPANVLHSPYVRAVETAARVAKARPGTRLVVDKGLVPHGSAEDVARRVLADEDDVLVVSHLPLLPALLELLIGGSCPFFVTPGAIVRLRLLGPRRAAVAGFLTQDDLVALT